MEQIYAPLLQSQLWIFKKMIKYQTYVALQVQNYAILQIYYKNNIKFKNKMIIKRIFNKKMNKIFNYSKIKSNKYKII